MILFSLSDIAPILNAKRIGKDCTVLNVTTDSRLLEHASKSIFVALQGKRFDGHNFAKQAIASGAVALLVNRQLEIDTPQLIVDDTYHALIKLAYWVRQQVSTKIVTVTGSSGKTSVKEIAATILSRCGKVLATEKNFNNEIGVLLTLLRLHPKYDFAVIELGASHSGDISSLIHFIRPNTALVNNVSVSHLEGFGSISVLAKTKGEIFSGLVKNGRGIINADSNSFSLWEKDLHNKKIWRFSLKKRENVDFFATNIISSYQGIRFFLHSPYGKFPIQLPLLGRHNVANTLAASALALSVGASTKALLSGLTQVKSVPGRLFPILLKEKQLLLDDSYNANVGSMTAAIETLADMPGYRVMVISDIAELGTEAIKHHQYLDSIITKAGIDKVLSIGKVSHFIGKSGGQGEHFKNKNALISRLITLLSEQITFTVLVKGSRSAKMEQIVYALREKLLC